MSFNYVVTQLCLLTFVLFVTACARPVAPLPGQLVEIDVVIPEGEVRVVDWRVIGRLAVEDGFSYTRKPLLPQKPTREQILAKRALDEKNAQYTAHVENKAMHLRAQPKAIENL